MSTMTCSNCGGEFGAVPTPDGHLRWAHVANDSSWCPGKEPRGYGTDETADFDTLAEATRKDDGAVHIEVVQLDKRA